MKKTTLKTIAIALVMTLMLAMTACGGNTFEEDSFDDSMLDAVKEQLVSGLESTASTFEGIASDLNDELKVENSTVVVRYLYNGETLAESEYTAD